MERLAPNLFIIGAPKSGTTSLYQYLRSHPNIFMCTPKEPNYFSNDLNGLSIVNTLDEYQCLFKKRKKSHKVIGEASVWYLYSDKALNNIYHYNKDAKIIVMLRNPIGLFQSLHQHFIYNGFEDKEDLKEAWSYQKNRQTGKNIPKYCPDPKLLQYKDILKLGHQVEKLYSIFPKRQIKFILFDDFIRETSNIYKSTLSFLDLEYDNRVDFPITNQGRESRYKVLNHYFLNPPMSVKKIWDLSKKIFGNKIINFANKIILVNTKETRIKESINLDFIVEIKKQLRSDINKLSSIIDRDLDLWLK